MTTTVTAPKARGLIARLLDDGGFTVDPVTGESAPATGYVVSLPGLGQTFPVAELTASKLASYAASLEPGRWFGAWLPRLVYLDASINVPTLAEALKLGRRYHQLAIWDAANDVEIPVTGQAVAA